MANLLCALARIKSDPSLLLDPAVIDSACRRARHRFRRCVLDPVLTLAAFLAQIAHGNTALTHVVRLFGARFNASPPPTTCTSPPAPRPR
jgi:hypothetical protein